MIFDYRKHRASHGVGNLLRVLNEITRGIEAPAKAPDYPALSPWASVLGAGTIATGEVPVPAGAPASLGEGDRVKLVRPFWGMPDPDTGVLVRDRDAPTGPEATESSFTRTLRLRISWQKCGPRATTS
jgi:hypothetical protein